MCTTLGSWVMLAKIALKLSKSYERIDCRLSFSFGSKLNDYLYSGSSLWVSLFYSIAYYNRTQ